MSQRTNPYAGHYALIKPLVDYSHSVEALGLEPGLMELVKIRASQMNGCVVCLHMHAEEARRQGETADRILMLDAWQECPLYSDREKAALAWTEALTRLTETRAPDHVYETLRKQFSEEDQVKLTLLINVINSFNRFGVGFRVVPPNLAKAAA